MTPRLYLLLGLAILLGSLSSRFVDDRILGDVLDFVPALAGFMAIGHAAQQVCAREEAA